jgi:hypothetical protein
MLLVFVRYLDGVLRYDELVFGTPIWYRGHAGIWVDRIWVDSVPSLWGGRRLWGVPKQLARFAWQGDTVAVMDGGGHIVTLSLDRRPARLPECPLVAPGFGQIDGQMVVANGQLRGRLGRGARHCRMDESLRLLPHSTATRQYGAQTLPHAFTGR